MRSVEVATVIGKKMKEIADKAAAPGNQKLVSGDFKYY